jgi:protocatechuate 3,4-dioxygenase beta subunit
MFVPALCADEADPSASARDLDAVRQALESGGKDVSDILTDPARMGLHADTRFRELIRAHAWKADARLVTPAEPGQPIVVRCTVRDEAGKPVEGAVVYVYHTSAKGWYAADRPHVRGHEGDRRHARLFGYVRTGADGRFTIRTIRPAGYPQSDLPQHIHVEISASGKRAQATELLFEDDPRLTPERRTWAKGQGFTISPVRRDATGIEQCSYELVVKGM